MPTTCKYLQAPPGLTTVSDECSSKTFIRDVNRLPVNRITGYVTRDQFQLTVTDTRKSNCYLRHLAVGRDTSMDRKQIMIKTVHCSRCRRLMSIKIVTAANLQRALSTDAALAPTSHPLSDTGPCTGRLAGLMSATATWWRCRRRPLIAARTYNTMCLKNKWRSARFQTSFYYNHIVISDSTDGKGDRFLIGYNDSMIDYEKIRV